jgi:hypothetical protein
MSKDLKLVSQSDAATEARLEVHKKFIGVFLKGEVTGAKTMLSYRFLIGRQMLLAKDDVPHGNSDTGEGFKKWLLENYPEVHYRSAVRRMDFAKKVISKSDTLSLFKNAPLQLKKTKLSKQQIEAVVNYFREEADGQSEAEYLRDIGIIREPKPTKYTPPKPPSPAEQAAAELAAKISAADNVISTINLFLEGDDYIGIPNAKKKQIIAAGVRMNKQVGETTK